MSEINFGTTIEFHNGQKIPALGFGVFQISEEKEFSQAIEKAISVGYRLFDTAQIYDNEEFLGSSLKSSALARNEYFITTKVWETNRGYDKTLASFEESLKKLQTDYVDLLLIHWPWNLEIRETWKAFERLYEEKSVKSIGVSNFHPNHFEQLLKDVNEKPVINQIEIHPYLSQVGLSQYLKDHDIVVQSWSPLGHGGGELNDTYLIELAEKYHKTPAQIILRWHLQRGFSVIPKSANPKRLAENANIFDFNLTENEILAITGLNRDSRWGPDPDVVFNNNGFPKK